MIQVSPRYTPHILVLVALVAVPAWLHHAGRFDVDDCADSQALMLPVDGATPPVEQAERYSRLWGEGNWGYGRVSLPSGAGDFEYVIVRSFDPKKIYHRPEARLVRKGEHRREMVRDDDPRLPIQHVVYEVRGPSGRRVSLASYFLVYGREPVSNPYWAQLITAPLQFVSGRRPMWLFLVYGEVRPKHREVARQFTRNWLLASWERYRSLCLPE